MQDRLPRFSYHFMALKPDQFINPLCADMMLDGTARKAIERTRMFRTSYDVCMCGGTPVLSFKTKKHLDSFKRALADPESDPNPPKRKKKRKVYVGHWRNGVWQF